MEQIVEFISELFYSIYVAIVDAIALIWPSTPEQYKIGAMLSNLPTDNFMFYFVLEAFEVVAVILGLVALYKLIKILPFT